MSCFWCDKKNVKLTKDHLLCRFIRKPLIKKCTDPNMPRHLAAVRLACYECNQQRCRISNAYKLIKTQEFDLGKRRRTVAKLLTGVNIRQFQHRLNKVKLKGGIRTHLITEINVVVTFAGECREDS